MRSAPNARDKIKITDEGVSTNHEIFLTNRFPRLISLPMSTIFVSGTSGITVILKYRGVNPIDLTQGHFNEESQAQTEIHGQPSKNK